MRQSPDDRTQDQQETEEYPRPLQGTRKSFLNTVEFWTVNFYFVFFCSSLFNAEPVAFPCCAKLQFCNPLL